jgi:D-hydroxyproline dehydrogenase subunit gamma
MRTGMPMFRKVRTVSSGVTITVDGDRIAAEPGEPLAAVLLRTGSPYARIHPVSGAPRGPFCMMGICHDCYAIVDGVASTQTCLVTVHDGMVVVRQKGPRESCDA